MKATIKKAIIFSLMLIGVSLYAQNKRDLDNWRAPDQRGVNVFEAPKDTVSTFERVKVRVGGSSTLQFQALSHENGVPQELIDDGTVMELKSIGSNFNLATANLDLDVALAKGVRMHLRTYLSSRHHPEPYVKGGYFQIDNLDFISEGLLDNLMKYTTLKVGHMENNYGDAHFRRTDNAQAIYNPFVGNLIMDSFTTEVGAELYYQRNGFLGMIGFTNGKLNQSVAEGSNEKTGGASFIAKLGYDNQLTEDLRVRLTGSVYTTGYVPNNYLYTADRAGSRYYFVMEDIDASAKSPFRSGRFDPGFRNRITAVMFNPFVKYNGLEFFGTIELANGRASAETDNRSTTQLAGEIIYRFGQTENFYLGGRYNTVSSEQSFGDVDINRFQFSAGYFLTKNILAKLEYVNQTYDGYPEANILYDGKFNGLMVEAVISF
ncbi:hypothetical protein [Hanstruepera marina]|uniref:hypothetical protein n=1 Tax=Hanstruepera marina TaxID=2873265 RepID=UPI001CA5F6F1|nr:hypothetical protein [Hanstruepera marina]